MADGLKTSISTNRQNGTCFAPTTGTTGAAGAADTIEGKYGTATILEESTGGALICGIHYKFKATGVSDKLKDKEIVLKADEVAGKLVLTTVNSKTTSTEINKYLPNAFR